MSTKPKSPAQNSSISTLDLRQMRMLYLLLTTRSVSRTAGEVGISQPAVSAVLARLRRHFDDPLLVRAKSTFVLTDRAEQLLGPLDTLLKAYEALTAPEEAFDPATSSRRFTISSPNYLSALLVPELARRVGKEAPGVRIEARTAMAHEDYSQALASGLYDLMIGNWEELPPTLRAVQLFEDQAICIAEPDHPMIQGPKIEMETYLQLDHVSPSPPRDARLSPVDGRLQHLGLKRRIAMVVPDYLLIPRVVARTRLVFTTGAAFAGLATDMAPVAVHTAPDALSPIRFRLIWHERNQGDPGHKWLRALLRDVMTDIRRGKGDAV